MNEGDLHTKALDIIEVIDPLIPKEVKVIVLLHDGKENRAVLSTGYDTDREIVRSIMEHAINHDVSCGTNLFKPVKIGEG